MDMYEAIDITDQEEAKKCFAKMVESVLDEGRAMTNDGSPMISREEAEVRIKDNLGYTAGYYGRDVQERVETLYGAVHPIFGPVGGFHEPQEPSDAFSMGMRMGEIIKRGGSLPPSTFNRPTPLSLPSKPEPIGRKLDI